MPRRCSSRASLDRDMSSFGQADVTPVPGAQTWGALDEATATADGIVVLASLVHSSVPPVNTISREP